MLRVRVDYQNEDTVQQLTKWLDKYGERYLVVKHEPISENIHYHAWIESKYKEVTLRMSFKNYVKNVSGNKDFALQKCDQERYEEYLTYMFNKKQGNRATFICHKDVDNWEEYEQKSEDLTEQYFEQKGVKTKNDIITFLLSKGKEYASPDEIFDSAMEVSKANGIVLSINAIREIIVYVGYYGGDRNCRGTVRLSVLKIFS